MLRTLLNCFNHSNFSASGKTIVYVQYVEKVLILSNDLKFAIYKIIYTSTILNIISEHIEQGAYFMI